MTTQTPTEPAPLSSRGWLIFGAVLLGLAAAVFLIRRSTTDAPFAGRVVEVSEGDTLTVLRAGQPLRIRLEGVDAPELSQAFGPQAKEFLTALASGREAQVSPKGREAGGIVASVAIDGRDLGQQLMTSGFAWHFTRRGVDPTYAASENEARSKRLGLWSDPSPTTPWEYRAAHPK